MRRFDFYKIIVITKCEPCVLSCRLIVYFVYTHLDRNVDSFRKVWLCARLGKWYRACSVDVVEI